jgi:hypothetical protein
VSLFGQVYDPDELVAAYARLGTMVRVAEEFGCSEVTVRRAVHRDRGRLVFEPIKFSEEEREFILYLLEDGAPYTEVALTISERRGGERVTANMITRRWPGYGIQSPSETLAVARARRDFERLVDRLGLDRTPEERRAS